MNSAPACSNLFITFFNLWIAQLYEIGWTERESHWFRDTCEIYERVEIWIWIAEPAIWLCCSKRLYITEAAINRVWGRGFPHHLDPFRWRCQRLILRPSAHRCPTAEQPPCLPFYLSVIVTKAWPWLLCQTFTKLRNRLKENHKMHWHLKHHLVHEALNAESYWANPQVTLLSSKWKNWKGQDKGIWPFSFTPNTNFHLPETQDKEKYPNVNWHRDQCTAVSINYVLLKAI